MTDDGFERGILTKADRKYLRNPEEYSRQASYNREEKINQRIQRAFNDFPLLAKELDDSVLEGILKPDDDLVVSTESGLALNPQPDKIPSESLTLPDAVAFLIRASMAVSRRDPSPGLRFDHTLAPFVSDVEHGIERWLNEHYNLTGSVNVSVTVDDLQRADSLVDKLGEQDEPLTGFERIETISQLSRAGYSTEEIDELIGERPDSAGDTEDSTD